MTRRRLDVAVERFPLAKPFTISRSSVTELELVTATITEGEHVGRGECRPYPRYGETTEDVVEEILEETPLVESELDAAEQRDDLLLFMPAGAARNALDCALWDLEAKITGRPVHALLGLPAPAPVLVTYTIGLDTPAAMAAEARAVRRPLLKLKLGGEGDLERVRAVREAVPESRLIVDANEAWSQEMVVAWSAELETLGVELIEQPLHAERDRALLGLARPVPLCADESGHGIEDLDALAPLYDYVNIKLDKTGGLTAALHLAEAAEKRGFGLMLGCMMATSLAMAPAFVLAPRARFVDLDAPLLLARDREPKISYDGAMMQPPPRALWG